MPTTASPEQVLEATLAWMLKNPEQGLAHLDRMDAETSLLDFVKLTWSILEPKRVFIDGWVIGAIAEHLEAITNGEIRRLLINVPPGFMKSMMTNVFWPAWEWGPRNLPDMRYVGASYSEALTVRDNRRARQLIESELYRGFWGHRFRLAHDQNAKVRYDTDKTGFKIATSVSGMGTGERGDRFIIDDPHNVKEGESVAKRNEVLQWFTEVVPSRINDPDKSAIIVIMQRVHEQDVSGLILEKELGYEHLCIPMEHDLEHPFVSKTSIHFVDRRTEEGELAWPERFSERHLEEDLKPSLRAWGGEYAVAGQLQQRPSPRGGGMFKRKDWGHVKIAPGKVRVRARGWDLAATDDAGANTAGVLISVAFNGAIYIEDCIAGQWGPKKVEVRILGAAKRDGLPTIQDLPQDPGQAGKAQKVNYIQLLQGYDVRMTPESGSKEDRARPLAAQVEGGNVFLVEGAWNDEFVAEAASFPKGRLKDRIDAASRAYARCIMTSTQVVPGVGAYIPGG
jgi:predicted phage terminase large subunit-like protein